MQRCDHGNYLPTGLSKSPGCSGCETPSIPLAPRRRIPAMILDSAVTDAAEYSSGDVSLRLADAARMYEMTL